MKTAIDSSALLAIFNGEDSAEAWVEMLIDSRRMGRLVICEVVYSEVSQAFTSQNVFDNLLQDLGIAFEPIESAAAWDAGAVFRSYRAAGGPREFLIPDFLIASHAALQADRLLAHDRGYLRRYFKALEVAWP